jgi:hypothetical protein
MQDREKSRRDYEGDVAYEVWRSGGNVDRINDDRVRDSFYDGDHAEDVARRELKAQRPRERVDECDESQYPEV